MRATERYVNFYDLVIRTRAQHAPIPSIVELINLWNQYGLEKGHSHERDRGTLRYRIGDMAADDMRKAAILLIRRADQNAPNATFSKLDTGELRIEKKEDDEGGDSAAHVVISTASQGPNTYFCLIETVPGLSHRIVQGLLNDLIRQACKDQGQVFDDVEKPVLFAYQDPSGANDRQKPFQPHIELRGHLARSFAEDLDAGTLRKIELVKSTLQTPLGGDAYLVESESKLIVEPKEEMPAIGKLDRIMKAISGRKGNFDTARIAFKDPHDRSHTVNVALDEGAPEQQIYVQSDRIREISPPLDQSSETIQTQLSSRMIKLMVQERDTNSWETSSISSDVA